MTWSTLSASNDTALPGWLFHVDPPPDGPVRLRPDLADLACGTCGKFDELAALRRGFPPRMKFRCRSEVFRSNEQVLCAGERFRAACEHHGLTGLEFVPVTTRPVYALLPVMLPTDPAKAKMQFEGEPCPACGRYRDSIFVPSLRAVEFPAEVPDFFTPSVQPEGWMGRRMVVFASPRAAEALKASGVGGLDWESGKVGVHWT